jgi:hypothetical protein
MRKLFVFIVYKIIPNRGSEKNQYKTPTISHVNIIHENYIRSSKLRVNVPSKYLLTTQFE